MTPPERPRRTRRAAPAPAEAPPDSSGASFVLSCVDEPQPGIRLHAGSILTGKGWAVSQSAIASIAVHLGERFLCYASYGQPRPEIGRDFGHYPQAHHAGFVFSTRLGAELEQARGADLEFRFRTEDGSESRRHVRLNWAPDAAARQQSEEAARPWPIRLGLEECRIDPAGRLRLRGWAIARTPITSLDLYFNEIRLHDPEQGLERADIAQRHPAYPGAAQSGFRLVQLLGQPATARDSVRVVARAGDIQRQIIVPVASPDDQRRLLESGAVSLCCEILRLSNEGLLTVAGWAAGAAETREIELLGEAGSLGLAEIGLPRPDIGNRFPHVPGARFAGFRFRKPAPQVAGTTLTLVVRDSDGGERQMRLPLPGALPSATADSTEPIYHGVDTPALRDGRAAATVHGVLTIAGWAVCASGVAAVEVWRDEDHLGVAYLGVRREDIGATYPDLPNALTSGFALTLPHRQIGDGEHTIRVVVRAVSGASTEEVFRVTMATDDDSRLGAVRRHVPPSETALRLELLARFGALPAFTVLIRRGAAEPRALASSLDSLRRQSLETWRAIVVVHDDAERAAAQALIDADPAITPRVTLRGGADDSALWPEQAAGRFDLLAILRAGDRFGADALMELAVEARLSGASFIYADERCFDPARDSVRPFLKPAWSPDLLLAFNYIGRAWCASRALAERCGLTAARLDRFGEYDAVLRMTETASAVAHLPLSLAERLGKQIEAPPRAREALQRAVRRRRIAGEILPGLVPGTWRLKRAVDPTTVVSVIIPTCGAGGLVRAAIASLRAQTSSPIQIVVLDDVPEDQPELKAWLRANADRVLPMSGPFNWSRANNFGARAASGTFLLFLNDDIECRDPDWLSALLEHAQRPEIGAVGPQLLYPDGKVQHAGMYLRGSEGIHAFRFAAADEPGGFGMALVPREVSAVTGACMLVRRAVFEQLGGFDEHHGVIKNDLDFCLRLGAAGLSVLYTPHARLIHHEMASRATLPDTFDAARFQGAWAIRQLLGDPLANPNLSQESEDLIAETEPVEILQPGPSLIAVDQVRRILVVKLDHIGDFICALPAIERLRAAFPSATITLLGAGSAAALAPLTSAIDDIVQFDFFAAQSVTGKRQISETEMDALAAELKARHFDIAVDLRLHPDTRHLLRYSGATVLAGFDHGGRFPWLDVAVEWEGDLRLLDKRSHVSATLLRLASTLIDTTADPLPARKLPVEQSPSTVARLLQAAGASPEFGARPLVCIHPGAGKPLKQWPTNAFAGLIRLLLESYPVSVVLIGDSAEATVAAEVATLVGRPDAVVSLAGKLPLSDLPALLQQCVLFVGNDSGPKHIAATLGVPTVGVHASHVDAAEWGPTGPRALAVRRRMSCGPCYISDDIDCPRNVVCLRGISPAQVYRACRLLLALTFTADEASASAPPASGIAIGAAAD